MKVIACFLLAFLAIGFVNAITSVPTALDELIEDSLVEGEWAYYSFDLDAVSQEDELRITLFPCYGAVDWYVRKGSVPTTNNFDFRWRFPDGSDHEDPVLDSVQHYSVTANSELDGVYYLAVYAHEHESHDHGDITFAFYAGYANSNPFPEAGGKIEVTSRGNGVIRVDWPTSDTANVEYCVYGHPDEAHDPELYLDFELVHGSPCAVEEEALLGCTTGASFLDFDFTGETGDWHFDVVVRNEVTLFENAYDGVVFDVSGGNSNSNNSPSSNNNSPSSNNNSPSSNNNSGSSSSASTLETGLALMLIASALCIVVV